MKQNVIQRLDWKFIFNFLLIDIINMKTYCVKCKKDTDNIDPKIFKSKILCDFSDAYIAVK